MQRSVLNQRLEVCIHFASEETARQRKVDISIPKQAFVDLGRRWGGEGDLTLFKACLPIENDSRKCLRGKRKLWEGKGGWNLAKRQLLSTVEKLE